MKYLTCASLLFALSAQLYAEKTDTLPCADSSRHVVEDKAQKSTYENCKRNGMTWWYNDQGKVMSEVNFINDQENGIYTSYYDNGTKKLVVNYINGQKDGIQRMYYDNGQLGSEVKYVMGKREGVMTEWDDEGFKASEVFYKNNYMVGIKKYFDQKGNVVQTEEYDMDRNPVMEKLLKDKRKEIMIDLSKYGLMPKDAPESERVK